MQLKESDALLRQSLEKLDTLIRLTTDLNVSATPLKSPAPVNTAGTARTTPYPPSGGGHPVGPTPSSAVRHSLRMDSHPESGLLGTPEAHEAATNDNITPQVYELPSGDKQYSPTQMKIISYQDMQHRQDEMNQMQRLYDNLTQQLRRLFEEKTQLMEELAALRKVNMDLQEKLRSEGDWYQQSLSEMKIDFESQLRAAKVLTQEAKEQAAVARAAEKKLQEAERECNMRIADLDTQLNSRVLEVTTVRTSLSKAQQRLATLQEELATAVSNSEDNEVQMQEARRKLKELSRTSLSKDELITSLQKEVVELQNKIKKPFTTSVKVIENTEKRINYDYEIAMLKDSVLAIQESEAELQKEYLNLQAESKKEMKRLKDASAQEIVQANAEHEAELDKLRKELQSRRRHLEQQTRLRAIAEEELADLRVQYVKMEEAVSQYRLDNTEISHGNELVRNQVEELQDKLAAKQDEISKILTQLQRARKRIEKVEAAHDEKDKQLTELTLRQQRLQQSIRTHAEREIDHLHALKHTMQSTSARLSADSASTLLLKNASPQSATSSPIAVPLPTSVRGRKLSLSALESECDALWEDIPHAVETVLNELKQYHNRTHSLSSDLQMTRVSSTTISTELSTHISRQEQEIAALKNEIETREMNAKKRLEKFKTSSQAEFTAQIDRLKGELSSMSQQIDTLAADKAQQINHLKSERSSVQSQLDTALQQVQDLTRKTLILQDAQDLAEKRCRTAAVELINELNGMPTLHEDETSPGKSRASPAHHLLSAEAESTLPPEQLLASATIRLRTKAKELNKFLKSRRRSDTQQQDAMKTFFESLNSCFVSVTQSHRAHLLHDQLQLLGTVETPIKSAGKIHRTDHSHLYNYLCGDDAELSAMLHSLEDNIFNTLQRSNNVETHLIHKQQEMKDLQAQVAELQNEISHAVTHKETLTHKLTRLESNLHEHITEVSRTNEEMSEKEQQLIRDREFLEADLTEVEERLQVASQRNHQLELSIGNLEDELGGTQQELRDARRTLDEVFGQLQASQGKLGDMQLELRATIADRDSLQHSVAQVLSERDHAAQLSAEKIQHLQKHSAEERAKAQRQCAEQLEHLQKLEHAQRVAEEQLESAQKHAAQQIAHIKKVSAEQLQEAQTTIAQLQSLQTEHSAQQIAHIEKVSAEQLQEANTTIAELQALQAQTSEQSARQLAHLQKVSDEHLQEAQATIAELQNLQIQTSEDSARKLAQVQKVSAEKLQEAQATIAELQTLQTQTSELNVQQIEQLRAQFTGQVAQLREVIAEGKNNYFLLETEKGKVALQLTQAEETIDTLRAELQSTEAQLTATRAQLTANQTQLVKTQDQLESKLLQIVKTEQQISELCGEVENHSASFRMESSHSRQVKEQLVKTSTALASLQISHATLQKEFDECSAQLAEQVERNTHLEAHIDELEHEMSTLKRTAYDLQVHASQHEQSHAEVVGHNAEYQAQLQVYEALDIEFHEVQHELTLKTEELQRTLAAHADEVQQYEIALQDAAARQKQFEEEQEILSEKLISLANQAAEWPLIQEELEANISVGQGQIKALTAQVAENEERLQKFAEQAQILAQRERELEETREIVHQLEDQLEATHHNAQQTHHSLATVHSTREMLETQCDTLSYELQQQKQYLSETQELVRHHEFTLVECAKQESVAKSTIRGLEAERASLREKLDAVTVSCTDAQIELAEKSTTLKLQLEMKAELIQERDRLRDELDNAADGQRRMAQQVERYKLKLEEVTKECNFIKSSVDKKEHTFVSQRNTIRDLRDANDELETLIQDLSAKLESVEIAHHKNSHWEAELEDCRKQLQLAAQEKEQSEHNNFALTATRKELEATTRELQSKAEMERTFRQNCAELEQSLRRMEDANRELSYRAQLVEKLQRDSEAAAANVRTLTSELGATRSELQSVSESLHSAKMHLETTTSALNFSKEDATVAKRELAVALTDLTSKTSAVEQFTRQKAELEHRVSILENENRDLQGKVITLDAAKTDIYNRTLETINKEKERADSKIEQLQERQLVLQQQADTATRESATVRRSLDDALAKLSVADVTVETLRAQVSNLQQDNAALKLDLGLRARELSHVEHENRDLSAFKAETETLRSTVADLQRQLQHQSTDRVYSESRDLALKTQEVAALRKELDEARSQLTDRHKYKQQFEQQERERVSVLRDLTELKVENERLQSRIKTTQMDMELSQRQFQFSNLMMAGGMRPANQQQQESPHRADRLSSAMENISSLLREKEVAVVQNVSTQQSLEMHVLQLAEAKHNNQALQEHNIKLESKVEKLREKLESVAVQRSADEHKNATLREEIHSLNTQVQIKSHDLQLKTQEVEKLSAAKEALERRLSDELRSLQEKWLKAQGDLQKELHVNQTLAFQVEDSKREKSAIEDRFRTEIVFLQKAVESAKQETTQANDQLLQVKAQGVNDKERVAILSGKVTELTSRIGHLEGKNDQQADELGKINSANAALSQKLSSAAKQCRDWELQCEQQQGKMDQLQARYEQQTAKCEQLQAKIDAMSKEIVQALAAVESNSGSPSKRMLSLGMRSDQSVSVDYLVQNLTTEIAKYETVYTEVTQRRSEIAALENSLHTLTKQDAAQKSQLQNLTSELSSTTTQLQETRSQLESLQQAHRESETALASLRSINSELEYMCDTMAKELKQAMLRVEELGTTSGDQKNEWMRQMEQLRTDADLRLSRELAPLQKQVKELSEQLQAQSQGEHSLQSDILKQKAELVMIQQDYESVTAATRILYEAVTSAGSPSSPSKTPVPDQFKVTSPTALIASLQSSFNEWGRTIHDLRTNAAMQAEALEIKNNLIDELQLRVQQSAVETQDCLHSICSELEKLTRVVASSVPNSPRSNPGSPAGRERKGLFSSPTAATAGTSSPFPATAADSAAVLHQRIIRVITALQVQYDRKIQAQAAECEKLRLKLAQRERDIDSATSIQSSAQQLQMAQEEQQMQLSQELFQAKEQQQAQHHQHVQQLQLFKESLNVQHAEQVHLLKETQQAQLAQAAQQLKQAQQALSRSLRERTVLQESLDALKLECKQKDRDIALLGEQGAATQAYWESIQDKYLQQIAELEEQLDRTPSVISKSRSRSPSSGHKEEEVFYFDGIPLTADEVRAKLEELVQYRDSTEQQILDFENLVMTTFYHKVEGSGGSVATTCSGGGGGGGGDSGGVRKFKSPQQLQFELEDEEAEDDRERERRRSSNGGGGRNGARTGTEGGDLYAFEPTSPVWRMHVEAQSVRKSRNRLRSVSTLETTPTSSAAGVSNGGGGGGGGSSSIVHTASDGLLTGMLQDFHKVLKEHRRLKRLCSSQQVCIMALR